MNKHIKAGTGRTKHAEWDIHGNHLSGQCGWGGWRIKRHGDVARVLMQFLRAAGFRATDKCFYVYPACQKHAGGTKTNKRIPDIVATDQPSIETRAWHNNQIESIQQAHQLLQQHYINILYVLYNNRDHYNAIIPNEIQHPNPYRTPIMIRRRLPLIKQLQQYLAESQVTPGDTKPPT